MAYTAQKFDHLLGLPGLSDALLTNHFTLYEGYVKNTNALLDALTALRTKGETATPEFAELKRRFGWEWNGMRLHELYFGNMTKEAKSLPQDSPLRKQIVADFGSFEDWEKDFRGTGAMRGIGWAALYFDTAEKKLLNVWVNEHDMSHLANATLLLIMDVFEHAFMLDYGVKRADYIDTFMKAIDWSVVESRFNA